MTTPAVVRRRRSRPSAGLPSGSQALTCVSMLVFHLQRSLGGEHRHHNTLLGCLLLLLATSASVPTVVAKELQEYCQYESFEASCGPDEVVMMTVARYGRMRIGRCVKTDFGFLGCYTDVLHLLDKHCSGRRTCRVDVVDPTFGNKKPCNQEFKNYLEASYQCVKVITPTGTICRSAKRLKSPPPDSVISSLVTEETGCGLPNTPYILEVPPGQTINLTLLDFHVETPAERAAVRRPSNGPEVQPLGCDVYTTLKEPRSGRAVDVCGGRERHNIIFISRTNVVEVIIHNAVPNKHHFLLKYEVLGCPDMTAPSGTWIDRHKDRVTIICNATQQVWQLRCQGNSWVGLLGNCSSRVEEEGDLGHMVFDVMSLPPAILIAIVAGIACLISFLILMMGVYYFKRKGQRRQRPSKPANIMSMTCTADDPMTRSGGPNDIYQQRETIYEARPQACTVCSREMTSLSNCDYAYMWDSPGSKPRRIKYDKLYSAGIYGPLTCKCVPMKLQELDIRDTTNCAAQQQATGVPGGGGGGGMNGSMMTTSAASTASPTDPLGGGGGGGGAGHSITYCDFDPDVVRTLDRRGELSSVGAELRTLGTFKDNTLTMREQSDGILQYTA